ncbi:class I SAM-dependent methyltransferase [Halorubellus sp. JP-L1]|uniref:class I SAM-dependent methyltransferase n=1 Tax=Halorubellus sp. JP-L1 TaxID=2715753 RepID=UPI00140768C3|nr:class I SAM-dependent methyltransferase [Halorubellus sp. JP-L1]NHN40627.1 class I SAM-dependent methyltransferase [Halorubellus sp. JP-L1]
MDRSRGRTRDVYDRIADHFASTREYAWPEVESFLDGRSGSLGLDVGCGNGRHAQQLAECCERVVGVDASRGLLAAARERAIDRGYDDRLALAQGDASRLPVATDEFDLAVYVATLHHLPDRESRVRSLDELARVLAPGGVGLVSAWSTAHDRFEDADADDETGFDTFVDWTLPGGETVERFYHVYAPAEFETDLEASALGVETAFVSSGNCYSVVTFERKTS